MEDMDWKNETIPPFIMPIAIEAVCMGACMHDAAAGSGQAILARGCELTFINIIFKFI
jgi:hypothetical protein